MALRDDKLWRLGRVALKAGEEGAEFGRVEADGMLLPLDDDGHSLVSRALFFCEAEAGGFACESGEALQVKFFLRDCWMRDELLQLRHFARAKGERFDRLVEVVGVGVAVAREARLMGEPLREIAARGAKEGCKLLFEKEDFRGAGPQQEGDAKNW